MIEFDDIYGRIKSPPVKAACDDLLAYFCGRNDFIVKPMTSGPKKAVHFAWQGKDIYGFIANNNWLLWYFRKPGTTIGVFSFEDVKLAFRESSLTERKNPNIREINMRLTNPIDARAVIEFAHSHPLLS